MSPVGTFSGSPVRTTSASTDGTTSSGPVRTTSAGPVGTSSAPAKMSNIFDRIQIMLFDFGLLNPSAKVHHTQKF